MSSSDPTPTNSSTSVATSSSTGEPGVCSVSPPLPSASKKAKHGDDDNNSSNNEFIQNFLECTICLDFPISPIHSCDNAHVLCGQCAPKFVACPTCRLPNLRPSPLGEKLAKEANKTIQCEYSESGCKDKVLTTKFVDHLARCYFRDITCDYKANCGVKVKFHDYTNHLKDAHNEWIQFGPKFTETYLYDEKGFEERHSQPGHVLMWAQWAHTTIKFKAHVFIVHAQISEQSQTFYSWVSVMGDRDLGDSYIVKVKFKDPKAPGSNDFGCTWRLPVLAFHDIAAEEAEAKLTEFSGVLALPMTVIRKWWELDQNKLRLDVTYEIKDA